MIILDGKKLNKAIAGQLREIISVFPSVPKLAIIQVGDNPASNIYIARKQRFAEEIGAQAAVRKFSETATENEIISEINSLNSDNSVNGIIVQLPIPQHFTISKIIDSISPEKDVDGLSSKNIYKLVRDEESFVPATALGIGTLLKENGITVEGKNVVVIGRSLLVGKSTALHLMNLGATVTICHSKTKNIIEHTRRADIIVVAVGKAGFLNDDYISEKQVIVDVGINMVDGKVCGDTNIIDQSKLKAISPVPGGVGPMTVASLFQNLVSAYKVQEK